VVKMPGAPLRSPIEGSRQKANGRKQRKRVADKNARHPSSMMDLVRYYHQGPPATKAAAVPSAEHSSASLSLMGPSFPTMTVPGPRIDSLSL
jgi:hypothetical protein